MSRERRAFTIAPAVPQWQQTITALFGLPGCGKTYSAIAMAAGAASVVGGKIGVIDTEARRACHYADRWQFLHCEMAPPFSSEDYLDAIEAMVAQGVTALVVDSMSHEHEGEGGTLEAHEAEVDKRGGGAKAGFAAWNPVKAKHKRLVSRMLQLRCHMFLCFRAKDILNAKYERVGLQPVAGRNLRYEMTTQLLLDHLRPGHPVYDGATPDQREQIKAGYLRDQPGSPFRPGMRLGEEHGAWLARWSRGEAVLTLAPETAAVVAAFDAAKSPADMAIANDERVKLWERMSSAEKQAVRDAASRAKSRMLPAR